jgi:hypothetical protein
MWAWQQGPTFSNHHLGSVEWQRFIFVMLSKASWRHRAKVASEAIESRHNGLQFVLTTGNATRTSGHTRPTRRRHSSHTMKLITRGALVALLPTRIFRIWNYTFPFYHLRALRLEAV